ncbi:hypothetical protein L195_g018902, partial [Trifolium pratense]
MASAETSSHIFLHCPFAAALWIWLDSIFNHHFDITTFNAVSTSCNQAWDDQTLDLATAAIIHIFHTIWMARNVECEPVNVNSADVTGANSSLERTYDQSGTMQSTEYPRRAE